ncbi:hypothetical protein BJX99DRAFT_217872 [Aspergillus californicus]
MKSLCQLPYVCSPSSSFSSSCPSPSPLLCSLFGSLRHIGSEMENILDFVPLREDRIMFVKIYHHHRAGALALRLECFQNDRAGARARFICCFETICDRHVSDRPDA